jgi:hypothetical protein
MDAVRNAVEPAVFDEAEKLLASGRLGEISSMGGGAAATVHNGPDPLVEVWVGVVAGVFTAECECVPTGTDTGGDSPELCVHAVALTLGALRHDFAWSSVATPPSRLNVDPKVRRLTEVAATLPARRLAMLVAEHAATDRRLETRLLAYAGKLGPLTDGELADVRSTIDVLAGDMIAGRADPHDVAKAGQWIVEELETLVQRPASDGALRVVEHAARVWDGLAGYLHDASETDEDEPAEIGGALRAVHVRMCAELQLDPDDLAHRLAGIITDAEFTSCLDEPEDYLALVGPDGVAAVRRARP